MTATILGLHSAIRALIPAEDSYIDEGAVALWEGQAPQGAVAPWVVSSFRTPEPAMSEGAHPMAASGELVITVSAETEDAANAIADVVDQALLGARVETAGWSVGALMPGYRRDPYPAGMNSLDTALAYQVAKLGYRFTYSRIPTPPATF